MSDPTRSKKHVCMDWSRDLSVDIHSAIGSQLSRHESSDPYCDEFSPLAWLHANMLTKHPSLDDSESPQTRKSLAISKLLYSDGRCRILNEIGYQDSMMSPSLNSLLKTAQSLLGNLLFGYDQHLMDDCQFSNGASQGFKLQDAAPFKKYAGQATVTPRAYDHATAAVRMDPSWYRHMCDYYGDESKWFKVVAGNGLFTVPKTSKIDRAAAKEPDMNMYLQKGVGSFIRKRLRTVGIDLNDQTRNQDLARAGSIDGSLATIDLSSASDSISDRLVWDLLPPSLYSYLDMIRSHRAIMPDGTTHKWALFSTMGNGFTFELESAIFWALAKSVSINYGSVGDIIGIYGDDIIIPVELSSILMQLLKSVGFLPNKEKSFTSGHFRESCGGHYFKGIDVKPFYIRHPITGIRGLLHILNRIRGWGNVSGISDPRLYDVWKEFSSLVPVELRGGCDTERTDYLVTLDHPRMRLAQRCRVSSGFTTCYPAKLDSGRLITWYHLGHGEIIETKQSSRFTLAPNKEWFSTAPVFPQEL